MGGHIWSNLANLFSLLFHIMLCATLSHNHVDVTCNSVLCQNALHHSHGLFKLAGMRDLNSNVGADSQGSFCFKWPFQHPLILSFVFRMFLILNTSNKKDILENGSIYLFSEFQNSPLAFVLLSLWSFLIHVGFKFYYGIIHFKYLLRSVKHTVLQNLESTLHAYSKLCRSATVYIS